MMIVDSEGEVCGVEEEPYTMEEIIEMVMENEEKGKEICEIIDETNLEKLEYIERKEMNDDQLVNVTAIDSTAVYHEDAGKYFDKSFLDEWSTKFDRKSDLKHEPIRIELKEGHTLTKMQPYRATPKKKEAWKQFEEKALKDGRIFKSNAPFCVPGLIIEKPERDSKENKR